MLRARCEPIAGNVNPQILTPVTMIHPAKAWAALGLQSAGCSTDKVGHGGLRASPGARLLCRKEGFAVNQSPRTAGSRAVERFLVAG